MSADFSATSDGTFGEIADRLGSIDEAAWTDQAKFLFEQQLVMEAPRVQMAWMMLRDSIHHRGQLSTYLRPMGSKVPAIYGPSADDAGQGH